MCFLGVLLNFVVTATPVRARNPRHEPRHTGPRTIPGSGAHLMKMKKRGATGEDEGIAAEKGDFDLQAGLAGFDKVGPLL